MDEYQFSYEEYKKRVYKNPGLSIYIICFFIIILIGAAFLLWPKQSNDNKTTFYFVEVDNFLVYKDANALAGEIQSRLGAGYVYFDTSYHVLASFYPTAESASAVVDNLLSEYPSAKLFSISCNKFSKHNNLTDSQNRIVAETIAKNNETIDEIYKNILNFDKNDINISVLKQNFTILATNYKKTMDEMSGCFSRNSNYFKTIKNIENIMSAINSLNDYVDNNEIFKLKYNLIKIVVEHCAYVNTF